MTTQWAYILSCCTRHGRDSAFLSQSAYDNPPCYHDLALDPGSPPGMTRLFVVPAPNFVIPAQAGIQWSKL